MSRADWRMIVIVGLAFVLTMGVVDVLRSNLKAQENDQAALRSTLLQNVAGFERNDLAAVSQIWADDESITVFENGHANCGWADYRDNHLVPEMAELKNTKYGLSDIKVSTAGTSAWATFEYSISAALKERHVEGGGLGTAVLENRQGRWQIVHWHTSSPPRALVSAGPDKKG